MSSVCARSMFSRLPSPPWNRWLAKSKCAIALSRERSFSSSTRRLVMIARYDCAVATATWRRTSDSFCCETNTWSAACVRCAQATGVSSGIETAPSVCVCARGMMLAPAKLVTGSMTLVASVALIEGKDEARTCWRIASARMMSAAACAIVGLFFVARSIACANVNRSTVCPRVEFAATSRIAAAIGIRTRA